MTADVCAGRRPENDAIERGVVVVAESKVELRHGRFDLIVFRHHAEPSAIEHVALVMGDVARERVPLRVHSECLTGEAFGSRHCDCGEQLDQALERIARRGHGVLIYLRQEGRGIGLGAKIRAYALQARGLDTFEANRALGLPDDARRYDAAAAMLSELGVQSVELLTNNFAKVSGLRALGVDIHGQLPMPVTVNSHNARYLESKRAQSQMERFKATRPQAQAAPHLVAGDVT
jgi:GTP cyclohydrolase II